MRQMQPATAKISIRHWQHLRLLLTTVRLQQKAVIRTSGFRSGVFVHREKIKLVEYVTQ
jgi:hypothetical protein